MDKWKSPTILAEAGGKRPHGVGAGFNWCAGGLRACALVRECGDKGIVFFSEMNHHRSTLLNPQLALLHDV